MPGAGHTCAVTGHRVADAVVVAAGSSRRMGGADKLAALIAGRPVLRWSVESLAAAPEIADLIVVTSPTARRSCARPTGCASSGPASSSAAGAARTRWPRACELRRPDIVLVHDAARPFVSPALIRRVVEGAQRHGAVIPALPIVDALKRVHDGRISGAADRSGLFRAQTPQAARRDLLLAACEVHAAGPDELPDEAELLARHGVAVHVVEGEATNIKVTLPEDLDLARRLAGQGAGPRVALGADSHPFGPGDGLRLGGLLIDGAPQLHGHSDGDVVLHALCDGLLAAAGQGDLGRLFPSGEPATRGVDSRALVAEVMARLTRADLVVDSVDATILGARPRLGGRRLDAMAATIAGLAGVDPGRVSVKAMTGNLAGDEGAGRVISATCLVSLVPR